MATTELTKAAATDPKTSTIKFSRTSKKVYQYITSLSGLSFDYKFRIDVNRTIVTASFTTSSPKIIEYSRGYLNSETDS